MKGKIFTLFTLIFAVSACVESEVETTLKTESGCVEKVSLDVNDHEVSASEVSKIKSLFDASNIDHKNFRYYSYLRDTIQLHSPPFTRHLNEVVKVEEYVNGLRVFTGQLVFAFKDGQFSFRGGEPSKGTDLDTISKLKPGQLRALFLNDLETRDHLRAGYKDSCVLAEFGYYNLNSGKSYTDENLVKAWKVSIKSGTGSSYPFAYYQDANGKTIYYDNGIRY